MNQTPQKESAQSARKSSKQHNKTVEVNHVAQSDNDTYMNTSQEGEKTPSRKNRKARKPSNARRNGVQSDAGESQEPVSDRPQQGRNGSKQKMTPAKAIKSDAYAGPTFHQSPAASAIPLPSFMPRSLPNPVGVNPIAETDGSPEQPKAQPPTLTKREGTPLDWMFNAARQGRGTPTGSTPHVVSQNGSPAPSPAIRKEETDFPFELDTEDETKSVYTTPLSQRFSAAKTHSTSEGGQILTDDERRAKTAALKSALMNPGNSLGAPFNENPFQARNVPQQDQYQPRQASNPSTPYQNGYVNNQQQYFGYNQNSPSRNYLQQTSRPPSSNLRNVYEPAFGAPQAMSPPATALPQMNTAARSPPPPSRQLNYATNFSAIYGGQRPSSEGNITTTASKPSLEQGLDDLRKALRLTNLGQQ